PALPGFCYLTGMPILQGIYPMRRCTEGGTMRSRLLSRGEILILSVVARLFSALAGHGRIVLGAAAGLFAPHPGFVHAQILDALAAAPGIGNVDHAVPALHHDGVLIPAVVDVV